MKNILRLEEAAMFFACIYVFSQMTFAWWLFPVFILAPDLSMIGYLANPAIGAVLYNFFHHKGLPLLVLTGGWYLGNDYLIFAGLILFAHSSMDRILGYGLKYPDSFSHTHLGRIGKQE